MTATRPDPQQHRRGHAQVRLRYRRLVPFAGALLVTGTAMLGGAGLLPGAGVTSYAAARQETGGQQAGSQAPDGQEAGAQEAPERGAIALSSRQQEPAPLVEPLTESRVEGRTSSGFLEPAVPLPEDSGEGRRVVFDMSDQRVWLVRSDESVARTYLVSGSVTDNLDPGTYSVYSRSPHAVGIDDSGTMDFMVRFAHGDRAPIGFHDIPVKDGKKLQSRDDLGTPQSHGCIRQWRPDAKALWRFAPLGTTVVVTA